MRASSDGAALSWQRRAACGQPENAHTRDWFYSKDPAEKYAAKTLCFSCPVRPDCLRWALEHRQIWGVWGGRDEGELRRALAVSHAGELAKRQRPPNCPLCGARPWRLSVVDGPSKRFGRWRIVRMVLCGACEFSWCSRTSARAVEAYHARGHARRTGTEN